MELPLSACLGANRGCQGKVVINRFARTSHECDQGRKARKPGLSGQPRTRRGEIANRAPVNIQRTSRKFLPRLYVKSQRVFLILELRHVPMRMVTLGGAEVGSTGITKFAGDSTPAKPDSTRQNDELFANYQDTSFVQERLGVSAGRLYFENFGASWLARTTCRAIAA